MKITPAFDFFVHRLQELFPGGYCPTPAHFFLKLLHDKCLLLSAFTQNIDGLEQLAGLPADKVVPAHGSFDGECYVCCAVGCLAAVGVHQIAAVVLRLSGCVKAQQAIGCSRLAGQGCVRQQLVAELNSGVLQQVCLGHGGSR